MIPGDFGINRTKEPSHRSGCRWELWSCRHAGSFSTPLAGPIAEFQRPRSTIRTLSQRTQSGRKNAGLKNLSLSFCQASFFPESATSESVPASKRGLEFLQTGLEPCPAKTKHYETQNLPCCSTRLHSADTRRVRCGTQNSSLHCVYAAQSGVCSHF